MDVKDIPLLVFDEMSKEFSLGTGNMVRHLSRDYRVEELEEGGFIAFIEDLSYPNTYLRSKSAHFEIWHHLPSELYSNPEVLDIVAGPLSTGTWVYGQGKKMKEDMIVRFSRNPLQLNNPLIPVISSALLFAQTMALSSDCQRDEYFEGERCPERDYTRP